MVSEAEVAVLGLRGELLIWLMAAGEQRASSARCVLGGEVWIIQSVWMVLRRHQTLRGVAWPVTCQKGQVLVKQRRESEDNTSAERDRTVEQATRQRTRYTAERVLTAHK